MMLEAARRTSPRARRTPASSCSSPRRRRSGCSARRRSTTRASRPRSATSSTTRPDRRDRRRLADVHARQARLRRAGRPRRACTRRRAAARSLAAARAIADMRLGRIDDETTANVGLIRGGTARNIVPECCSIEAEARSHDPAKLADARAGDARRVRLRGEHVRLHGRDEVEDTYRGYRSRRTSRPCARRRGAAAGGLRADDRLLGRRRRRERLQRARPAVRQPRERDDRHPHAGRAHRGRRPRGRWSR